MLSDFVIAKIAEFTLKMWYSVLKIEFYYFHWMLVVTYLVTKLVTYLVTKLVTFSFANDIICLN